MADLRSDRERWRDEAEERIRRLQEEARQCDAKRREAKEEV